MSPDELTLDQLRAALAPLNARNAVFDGWSERALGASAAELGVPASRARIAFPGGAADMIDAWYASIDAAMADAFPAERIAALKIRQRIRDLVLFRIDRIEPVREAARRSLAILAQPQNLVRGARLGWRSADAMWRLARDTATDFNHYSKRAILSGVYGATLLVWLGDESGGRAETRAFLDRRIDDVMRIEKLKAGWRSRQERLPSVTRFLGRLRNPVQ